jgi:hypothetical protein
VTGESSFQTGTTTTDNGNGSKNRSLASLAEPAILADTDN